MNNWSNAQFQFSELCESDSDDAIKEKKVFDKIGFGPSLENQSTIRRGLGVSQQEEVSFQLIKFNDWMKC